MDEGQPPKPDDSRRPTWSDNASPESVRPAPPTRPLNLAQDPDALVPAADSVMRAAYSRTGALPARPFRGANDATDALVIHPSTKAARVLNFEVEGVHWRAGFAPEPAQTPIGLYLPTNAPLEAELRAGNGFILRPVELELELILRDMVPERLLVLAEAIYGRHREPGETYLYFSPNAQGAVVGMAHCYAAGAVSKPHVLYLQTDVRKAEPRLLDEMQRTFRASYAARAAHGPSARPFDFWAELQVASAQVEATLRASSIARNSQGVKQRVSAVRESAETQLYGGLIAGFAALAAGLAYACVRLPQQLVAGLIRGSSQVMIAAIHWADGYGARQRREPPAPGAGPFDPPGPA